MGSGTAGSTAGRGDGAEGPLGAGGEPVYCAAVDGERRGRGIHAAGGN